MQRQYTATARILIEPPAGTDVRSATTAVSPIYLESLKTYESFAASDTLFAEAAAKLDLRALFRGGAIESIEKRVLKVGIVRNTRILEISATLPEPRKAQGLAQFIAESTVAMNRSLSNKDDQDLIQGLAAQETDTRAKLQQADSAWERVLAAEPVEALKAAMENSGDLRAKLQEQLLGSQVELAENADREKQAPASELPQIRNERGEATARAEAVRKQIETLDRQDAEREKLLAARSAHRELLDADRKARRASLNTIETRLAQARGDAGFRGERLEMIEPGIVPERPSSPNLPLFLAVALLLGFTLPVVYFAVEINFQELRVRARRGLHSLARND